jgi:methylglutaconyl-CoA hydratase
MSEDATQHEPLIVDLSERSVVTITFNRPERANAYTPTLLNELGRVLEDLHRGGEARVIVLRGAGRHFCAGADIVGQHSWHYTLQQVLHLLATVPIPSIALVHGGSVGGGAAMAACCDIVVADKTAFFSIPEIRIGIAPLALSPYLVPAMGHRNFRHFAMTGERIPAAEAYRIGLAQKLCDHVDLDGTGVEIANALLQGAPNAMRELKAKTSLAFAIDGEQADETRLRTSPEYLEGRNSFREKRKPYWYPEYWRPEW